MRVGAVHAHTSNALAAATRRRRAPAASWTHTGTHYLSSDGASGSYADAATSAAARVVFPSTAAPVVTFAAWVRAATAGVQRVVWDVSDDGHPRWYLSTDPGDVCVGDVVNDAGGSGPGLEAAAPVPAVWGHVCWVLNGADPGEFLIDGVSQGATSGLVGAFAGVDAFTLFADYAHASRLAGDIRDPAVWDRALSAAEVAALHTAGVGHDLREAVGAYTGGGPAHWWPADGDSGTTVTDRGSVGTCPLTLHGGVTIEEA